MKRNFWSYHLLAFLFLALGMLSSVAQAQTNSSIVFDSNRDGNRETYIMNADGSGQTRLTNDPKDDQYPSLSLDGSKIAWTSNRTGNNELFVMHSDGSNQTRLTTNASTIITCSFSPDGTKIAFSAGFNTGRFNIYVINVDGSNLVRLTSSGRGPDVNPSWSPDGKKIAYESTATNSGASDIFMMNADGSNQTNLTKTGGGLTYPRFTRDGSKIVFTFSGGGALYTINLDGTGFTQIATYPGFDFSISPDGNHISYDSGNVFTANIDGTNPIKITSSGTDDNSYWGGRAAPSTSPTPSGTPTPTPTPGPPAVYFNSPADGNVFTVLNSVSGSATGGTRRTLSSVTLSIRRNTDDFYWDGSKWVSSPVQLATTLSGNPITAGGFVTWSRTSGLPNGTDLIQASYTLTATATNNAGIAAVRSINAILGASDTRPPYIRINEPTALSRLNHLPTLTGVANDNPGGTGLSRVVVSIQRNSDGQYFDGFGWSPTRALLPTSLSKPAVPGNENTYTWTRSSVPGGTDLSDGYYQIIARAYDYNNNIAATTVFVFIDKQAPTLAFVSPLPGTAAQNLNVIQVNAQDAPGGSGLAHVDLTIRRNFDGAYWNGTTFTLNPTALPTSFGGNNFIYHGRFTDKQLSAGSYTLQATAYDKAGNRSVATSNVIVERTAPTVKFVTPAANTGASVLPVINGQAFDNFGGSGLSTVTLTIQRQSDNAYYNGTTFTSKLTPIGAKVTGSLFSFNTGFNTTNLRDGNYILTATATDRAGNSSTTKSTITIDRTAPQKVAFTTPTTGSTLASLSTIKGTATDNAVGSGIEQVVVYIQRRKDALYWTGAGWGPATALKTTLSAEDSIGPVTWTVATKLPSGATLQNDVYVLSAVATDRAGNTKSTAIRVTVNALASDSTATISPASLIALSKASTQAATSSVQLGFAGALDVNSATEVEHYEVVVNGQLVAVQSVAYSASTHTVALGLGEGVLHSGDAVVVSWTGLQDTQQRTVTGQATLTVR